jgi:hypothetical protein
MPHFFSFKFLYNLDLFGKDFELYYKGKNKKTTLIGAIFTIFYIALYFAFLLYKIIRMFQRNDVTFYDTYAFTGEPPKIQLTDDKFYGGFALGNLETLETFVDDSIYYVKANFIEGIKEHNSWTWTNTSLKIETCKLEKFGENYRDIFKEKQIQNLHCVPVLDQLLQGHLTYDIYSYFKVGFFPCINSTQNNFTCKPLSVIKQYLTRTFVTFKMEDIDLTPQKYDSPVQLRGKEVSANIGSNLFKDVHSFFQVVNIETDEDILGFDGLSRIKKEKYLKYDQSIILSSLKEKNIFESGESLCDITIQLSEKELTQKRTYTKLVEVLGDVGGLMEIFFSFFNIFSSFLTETLYEQSLVKHLFHFDIDKKIIIMNNKEENKKKNKNFLKIQRSSKIYSSKLISKNTSRNINEDIISNTIKGKNKDDPLVISKFSNENISSLKLKRKKIKSKSKKKDIPLNDTKLSDKKIRNEINIFDMNSNNFNNSNEYIKIIKDKEPNINLEKVNENRRIIKKIRINRIYTYFCFLCARKSKSIQNILLNEGMKLIIGKLDILNLFKNIYNVESIKENFKNKDEIIEMSDECKNNLKDITKIS